MIDLHSPSIIKDAIDYLKKCVKSGWVSTGGNLINQFEKKIENITGSKYAIACNSGTSALHLSLKLAGVKSEDELVMGVTREGKDEPIVLGAEPVLVTGKVEEGDYIVTSDKEGYGKSVKVGYLFKRNLFGKVIGQSLESADCESSLIKCMIRKM